MYGFGVVTVFAVLCVTLDAWTAHLHKLDRWPMIIVVTFSAALWFGAFIQFGDYSGRLS